MKPKRELNVNKITVMAIAANSLQILLVLAISAYLFLSPDAGSYSPVARVACGVAAFVVAWGALTDIREAVETRQMLMRIEDMEAAIGNMEQLNITLRSQRHDFLNHLQVVYSLMEMKDYKDACDYIEKVYGDITSLSRVMKTANPAINALLQVKVPACEKAGIAVTLNITSAWKDLPMPGWEMCKVLSNLIDNAIDALQERPENRQLQITMTEDIRSFRFSVSNNGPMIPKKNVKAIFQPGITTKEGDGHGMGLYIVRKALQSAGGDISCESTEETTEFSGFIPKAAV